MSQYCIGIDLGTTNSVLAYAPLADESSAEPNVFAVNQSVAPGQVEQKQQLPSFVYQAHCAELAEGDITLPWTSKPDYITGEMARALGSKTPIRLVASAKSWLSHTQVNPRDAFLPLNSPEEVAKLSPLEASRAYLAHLQHAWNNQHPESPLQEQDITLTVPASFDPAARELTAEAAKQLGFHNLTLLEEPQAALYSWINNHHEQWREHLSVGDVVLVIDVGGGTTDLSLVSVNEQEGNLVLERIAVGDHILLGGDNMDLALAYRLSAKLKAEGKQLQPWQILGMSQACRNAKETLLADENITAVPIVVPSRGSKLIGGTLQTELTRDELQSTLVDGFFPQGDIHQHPKQHTRSALTQMGLPYAQDAAITRHLAAFLCRQRQATGNQEATFIQPTAVLFNGGVLKSPLLAERLISTINSWLSAASAPQAKLLQGADLDLSVAKGAAYYGQVKQGQGVRIRGGIASSYYIGVESALPAIPGMPAPMEALCVAPFGMEEGSAVEITQRQFGLVVGQPVQFQFYGSTLRRDDQPGDQLDFWQEGELEELPAIHAELPLEGRTAGEIVPVHLAASVTELGILRLEAIPQGSSERWQVEFNVRDNVCEQ